MDNTFSFLYAIAIIGLGMVGVLGVLVCAAFRTQRNAMEILADLSSENRAGMENMFKSHAESLENLKAIETCGVDGMRGVVARSQIRPSVLDPDDEEPIPSPDKIEIGGGQYIEVGHMADTGPEGYAPIPRDPSSTVVDPSSDRSP